MLEKSKTFFIVMYLMFLTSLFGEKPTYLHLEGNAVDVHPIAQLYESSQARLNSIENRLNNLENQTPNIESSTSSSGIDCVIDAAFLYWYSTISEFSYAEVKQLMNNGRTSDPNNTAPFNPFSIETKEFDWQWNPGVRVGLGLLYCPTKWKLYLDWTYFYNSGSDSTSLPTPIGRDFYESQFFNQGDRFLAFPWYNFSVNSDAFDGEIRSPLFDRIAGKWNLLFHQIDLKLIKKAWLGSRFCLSPYIGVRGHWSRTRLSAKISGNYNGTGGENELIFLNGLSRMKQQLWAVGLIGGLKSFWKFTKHWGLISEGAISLVYGTFKITSKNSLLVRTRANLLAANYDVFYRHQNIHTLEPVIDLVIGFRWGGPVNNSLHMHFDLTWENHCWIDFNKLVRPVLTLQAKEYLKPSNGNLTLSGIVARLGLKF